MKVLLIKYSENYWIKVIVKWAHEVTDEGDGLRGKSDEVYLTVSAHRVKHLSTLPHTVNCEADLNNEELTMYKQLVAKYESSTLHKNLVKSNCKIRP